MKMTKIFTFAALLCLMAQGAWAQQYIECSWNAAEMKVVQTPVALPMEYNTLESNSTSSTIKISDYNVVSGTVVITGNVVCNGNVKLVLMDGAKLTIKGGITVDTPNSLSIYCQSYESSMGKLIVTSNYDKYSGIGGSWYTQVKANGSITIHGGDINTTGGPNGVGLGCQVGSNAASITIYGGRVEAHGGEVSGRREIGCAGIGVAKDEDRAGKLTIYGGKVYAYGAEQAAGIGGSDGYNSETLSSPGKHCGTINIYGGYVEAHGGKYGAGVGGGQNGNGGDVTVYGGKLLAYGGTDAAGIGSGEQQNDTKHGGSLTVYGGEVFADGTDLGCGIGGGQDSDGANVDIQGGIVTAWAGSGSNTAAIGSHLSGTEHQGSLRIGDMMMVHAGTDPNNVSLFPSETRVPACWYRDYARIEPCDHQGATYTINGNDANGTHTFKCSHCLSRPTDTHTFVNGTCTVCGAGASLCTISIYLPEMVDGTYVDGHYASEPRTQQLVINSAFTVPAPPVANLPNGVTFAGWAIGTPSSLGITSYWIGDDETTILEPGSVWTIRDDASLTARYRGIDITLADDADNGETLYLNDGKKAQSVTLSGRTLIKDGRWQTLCLPFALSSLSGTPLEGAEVKTLESATLVDETGKLTLNFSGNLTAIEAGRPYIVRWTDTEGEVENPVFRGVTIHNTISPVETDEVSLRGAFSPVDFTENDKTVLCLGSDNKLYHPSADTQLSAFRAYFEIDGLAGAKVGDVTGDGSVTVSDVTAMVDIILGKDDAEPYSYNHEAADIDGAAGVTVSDVTRLVNIILGNDPASQRVKTVVTNVGISME